MSGNTSESEEEVHKHLPLNREEVAVLESHLEQWDNTSGKDRNKVWKDTTTEARLKAPKMDAAKLRSRKTIYRKWLQNHGEKKDMKAPINLGRKWTYQTVVGALRKKELLKKIEDDTGVKAGEKDMMKYYSKYFGDMVNSLTKMEVEEATEKAVEWNKQGVPPNVQADTARRKSEDILRHVAAEMFKKAGMRLFILSAWKGEEGKLMVSSHDFNREIGNGESSFTDTHNWKDIVPEWKSYASKQFDKEVDSDDTLVKKGRKDKTYVLKIGDDGFPVLLDHTQMDSDTRKAVVRAFLNWHYQDCTGRPKEVVPWKEVIPRQEELIPPLYLPDGRKLQEPSRMNRQEATELLEFWYDQQEHGRDATFEFHGWWSKSDKEIKPSVRWPKEYHEDCEDEELSKPVRRFAEWAVIQSDSSGDDNNTPRTWTHTAEHRNRQPIIKSRGKTKPGKASGSSNTRQESAREFVGGDVVSNITTRQPAKTRLAQSTALHSVSEAVDVTLGVGVPEPSASQEPPTPLDNPQRVGPVSCPGGKLWKNLAECSDDVDKEAVSKHTADKPERGRQHGPKDGLEQPKEKRVRLNTKGHKRPAKDALQDSPAKRTRSKATDLPPKRSKKPNSRYAANFIRS
ncbi:uncharacterized protein HD556DRAFT_1440788 [Suillus plorans]|uniref:Uncharacterized protein n=1 Tax=Suillus plorans TaxID=116603 RepID=A0A9P7DLI9_9AGAM|nr:uncharacterized protein HD556DRAFT_1440788 [Suillus plorans]KAG1797828.1 hypothetical protein HD556DRAFT_1440788 [Suillus plorans]